MSFFNVGFINFRQLTTHSQAHCYLRPQNKMMLYNTGEPQTILRFYSLNAILQISYVLCRQPMNTKQSMSILWKSQCCSDFQSKLGTKGYASKMTMCSAFTVIRLLKASVVNSKNKKQRISSETIQRPFRPLSERDSMLRPWLAN